MYRNGLGLKDLVSLEDWQKIQDSFSEALGITLRTIDLSGKLLTRISNPPALLLYEKIKANTHGYSKFCKACPIKEETKAEVGIKEEANFKCPFGMDVYVLPIKPFGNKVVTYIIVGPVILEKRKLRSEYNKDAKKAGIDPEELFDMLIDINVFSHSKMRTILTLLTDMFSYMAQTGFHKKRLGEIAPEVVEIDPLFSSYYEEKVLTSLLNTCIIALDADSGSVMTVDKKTEHLHIKAASKLNKDVAKTTDMKMGEGIAGLAAATSMPIILPKDRGKNGLSGKMKRSYIKSSIIVPFNKANKQDVYGVININVVRKEKEFTDKDITLVKELVNLASIALIPVK
ncbi:PocR ligand-binding domain-containing protein [Omnitrophica bacterium]|nr:PocR ligand-binding domain-containing protein [Candidatus Omnitrophota bacterium]